MFDDWDFMEDKTLNSCYSFELSGGVDSKYIVLATKELDASVFIGVYGMGETPNDAYDDAKEKIKKYESRKQP